MPRGIRDLMSRLFLKYVIRYRDPRKYWLWRWRLNLDSEKRTTEKGKNQFNRVLEIMKEHECNNILEIGCGRGSLRELPNYLGLDFCLKILQKSNLNHFLYADLRKGIPLATKSQDAILSRYVLLHIPEENIGFVLDELSRVAKKLIILEEPQANKSRHPNYNSWTRNLPDLLRDRFDGEIKILKRR